MPQVYPAETPITGLRPCQIMKELILILTLFRSEAADNGLHFPDSVTISYSYTLGRDTLGVATRYGDRWEVKVSAFVEADLIETVVYHELGHVAGLDHCRGRSIMNYGYMVPLTPSLKNRLFQQIRQFQTLCYEKRHSPKTD